MMQRYSYRPKAHQSTLLRKAAELLATEDRETKVLIVDAIVRETKAEKVQVIGKTLVLYRQSEDRKIELPRK